MIKVNTENGTVELTEAEYEQQFGALPQEADAQPDTDRIRQLAAGLSTAKTIAEIRSAAKQILDETNGGDTDE